MSTSQAERTARVIERLLVDPDFSAAFRRDPAAACRAAGLEQIADELSAGTGKQLQTLQIRESRSGLAGLVMAAALEAVGVAEFIDHVVPRLAGAPAAVRDAVTRLDLPALDELREQQGVLADSPDVPSGTPVDGVAPEAQAIAAGPPAAGGGAPVPPMAPPTEEPLGSATLAESARRPDGSARSEAPTTERAEPRDAKPRADAARTHPPPAVPDAPRAAAVAIDPAQFGAEGTGGPPSQQALALLKTNNVVFDADGVADIRAGRIDPRLIAVLGKLSEKHEITVSCMCSDHSKYTSGGSISNHFYGRGLDISKVDGRPVDAANPAAREIAIELGKVDRSIRPDEIGGPFQLTRPGYFTDADHADHLHVAFKQAIAPDWQPPAGQAGAGTSTGSRTVGLMSTVSTPFAPSGRGSETVRLNVADVRAQNPAVPPVDDHGAAERPPPGRAVPGRRALAALAVAKKQLGTAYVWGGSTPQTGFDCSGLVQWAYAQQGITIPRVTEQQIVASNGIAVAREDLIPGDLVFFGDPGGSIHHVGIALGGDRFVHAPHRGDVVKESSLGEPYYAQHFAGGRRFDHVSADAAATADRVAVQAARAVHARDATETRRSDSLIFKALTKQEASHRSSTVQFLRAVKPEEVAAIRRAEFSPIDTPLEYPGDDASQERLAAWMAHQAEQAGLPGALPVMAALVESGLRNLNYGDADSLGFFQMRVSIWNKGKYAGYPDNPDLQMRWFIDQALAIKQKRLAAGLADFGKDPGDWGIWIADIENPREDLRFKYGLRLQDAQRLLGRSS